MTASEPPPPLRPATAGTERPGRDGRLRLLAFGFVLTLLSGLGQTFFIGLFGAELRVEHGLSDASFGTLYSAATLVSAAAMVWAGAVIDRVALPAYAFTSAALVALGYLLLSVGGGLVGLALALFLLRFGGQGLLAHTSVTSVARFGGHRRGRSLSIALLGHPAGEAAFPPLAAVGAASLGWPAVWLGAAAAMLVAAPALARLAARLRDADESSRAAPAEAPHAAAAAGGMSRRDVLRDVRFYLLVPALLTPAFVLTGVFFHQARLVAEKGWPLTWFATMFGVFAAAQTVAMLTVGPLIDRVRARRLMPLYLLPLALASVLLCTSDSPLIAIPFMIGVGVTMGCSTAVVTSMWVEVYGAEHLGATRALGSSIGVVGAALAPAIFGWAIDAGVALDSFLLGCAALAAGAALLALAAARTMAR